jgi:hypothetical protein
MLQSIAYQAGCSMHVQFAHEIGAMPLDGLDADGKCRGDLRIGLPSDDVFENLTLPGRERSRHIHRGFGSATHFLYHCDSYSGIQESLPPRHRALGEGSAEAQTWVEARLDALRDSQVRTPQSTTFQTGSKKRRLARTTSGRNADRAPIHSSARDACRQ